MFKTIFNFLYRGTINDKTGIRLFNRGSITMTIQFILVGLYIIFLDPTPKDITPIKILMTLYLIISFFFIKPNKLV